MVTSGGGVFNTEVISDRSYFLQDLQRGTIEKELPEIFNYIKVETSTNHKIIGN